MAGLGQRILGGALAGAGTGIIEQAKQRRQDTLLALQRKFQVEDRNYAEGREDLRHQRGLDAEARKDERNPNLISVWNPDTGRNEIVQTRDAMGRQPAMQAAAAPKPPSKVQEYEYAKGQGYEGSYTDFIAMGRPSTAIEVNTSGGPAAAPKGYRNVQQPDGTWALEPVPGGPADRKLAEAAEKQAGRDEAKEQRASIVSTHADAIRKTMDESRLPVTGMGGSLLANLPGTDAHDMQQRLSTIKALVGFDQLNQMREQSPTGGALGNVTERELNFLQSVIGSLEQSQSKDQFLQNLQLVEDAFNRVVHGGEDAGTPQGGSGADVLGGAPAVAPQAGAQPAAGAPAPASPISTASEEPNFAAMSTDQLLQMAEDPNTPVSTLHAIVYWLENSGQ